MVPKDRINTILEPRTYRKDHILYSSTLNLMKHSWYHRRILPYTLYIVSSKQLIAHGKIFVLTKRHVCTHTAFPPKYEAHVISQNMRTSRHVTHMTDMVRKRLECQSYRPPGNLRLDWSRRRRHQSESGLRTPHPLSPSMFGAILRKLYIVQESFNLELV